MRLAPVVLGSVLLLGRPAGADDPQQIERAYQIALQGERALKAGNLRKAEGQFEKALQVFPGFSMAHLGLGHVAMQDRRFEQALASYREALRGYEAMGEALLQIQMDRYAESRIGIAEKQNEIIAIRQMIPRLKTPQQVQAAEARILELEGEMSDLENLPMPSPEDVNGPPERIHFFIGNALINLNRNREAVDAYLACCRRNPAFALAHHNLAIGLWKTGRLEEARVHLARAEELGLAISPDLKAHLGSTAP